MQTPQIFRTKLLRDCYAAALKTGATFTDDTAVVESQGHPVRIVLYHGVNMKVTTPSDWALAEALLRAGEGEGSPGQTLRKQLHDMNNHLTPLLGYAYLLVNEFPDEIAAEEIRQERANGGRALPGHDPPRSRNRCGSCFRARGNKFGGRRTPCDGLKRLATSLAGCDCNRARCTECYQFFHAYNWTTTVSIWPEFGKSI